MAKAMKPQVLRAMTDDQLSVTYKDRVKDLFLLRVQSATERLDAPAVVRVTRRDIARILTIQRERQILKELAAAHTTTNKS